MCLHNTFVPCVVGRQLEVRDRSGLGSNCRDRGPMGSSRSKAVRSGGGAAAPGKLRLHILCAHSALDSDGQGCTLARSGDVHSLVGLWKGVQESAEGN